MSLTLNIRDKDLIEAAKSFAKSQNKSLSVLVENVLRSMVKQPKVESAGQNELLGAFLSKKTSIQEKEFDPKWEYMKEKYGL